MGGPVTLDAWDGRSHDRPNPSVVLGVLFRLVAALGPPSLENRDMAAKKKQTARQEHPLGLHSVTDKHGDTWVIDDNAGTKAKLVEPERFKLDPDATIFADECL